MRVAVVANPVGDPAGRAVAEIERGCAAKGWERPHVLTTTVASPGAAQAREAVAHGAELVVAVGGDGTVREVAGALATASEALELRDAGHSSGALMGIVPRGTANLFARNLDLPRSSMSRAVEVALSGVGRDVDLGHAAWRRADGKRGSSPFVVLAGIGNDARTVELVRPGLKKHARWAAYFEPSLETLRAPAVSLTVSLDGGPTEQVRVWSLLAGNVGRIPLGIDVIPGATPDDGRLHVVQVAPRTLVGWLPIALKGMLRLSRDMPGISYRSATSVRVECHTPLTIQIDGDAHAGVVELQALIAPAAIRVNVPSQAPRGRAAGAS